MSSVAVSELLRLINQARVLAGKPPMTLEGRREKLDVVTVIDHRLGRGGR
jgi:hypothetical protein